MWTTTSSDFELFCAECDYWIDYLGLDDWSVIYKHEDCDGLDGGWIEWNLNDKHVEIGLTRRQETYPKSVEAILAVAFHEVLELMFVQFKEMAQTPYEISESSVRTVTHSIINKFASSVLREHMEKRKQEITIKPHVNKTKPNKRRKK